MTTLKRISSILLLAGSSLAFSNAVQAEAISISHIFIKSAEVVYVGGTNDGKRVLSSAFSKLEIANTSDAQASLQFGGTDTDDISLTEANLPNLDIDLYASVGSGGPANNTFTDFGVPHGEDFSVSDTELMGKLLDFGDSDTEVIANVYNAANVTATGTGSAQSNVKNSSTVMFTSGTDLNIAFEFELESVSTVWVSDPGAANFSQASGQYHVALSEAGSATPLFEHTYQYSLSSLNPGQNIVSHIESDTDGGLLTASLEAGTEYKFDITHRTTADVGTKTIPEPASIALIGLGLLGLSASARKRIKV